MNWTNQEVLDVLGEDAQVCARGIIVNVADKITIDGMDVDRRRNVLVASFEGNAFAVTEEGMALLMERYKQAAKSQKQAPNRRKAASEPAVLDIPPETVA